MDFPNHEKVWQLLNTCDLTGAEHEALAEYVTQDLPEWEREVMNEGTAQVMLSSEMVDLGICSQNEAITAESGYATSLIRRVNSILQNWGVS